MCIQQTFLNSTILLHNRPISMNDENQIEQYAYLAMHNHKETTMTNNDMDNV